MQNEFWAECASTATQLYNSTPRLQGKSPYTIFHGKLSKMEKNLRIFGEISVKITRSQVHHEKLDSKRNKCFFCKV
jgi:hypothetical protein